MELFNATFMGEELNNLGFSRVMWHDFDRMPTADENINTIATSHLSTITKKLYVQKTVVIRLMNRGCTEDMQAKIARIRQVLQYKKGDLVLDRGIPVKTAGVYTYENWTSMTFKDATLDDVKFDMSGRITVAEVTFNVLDPIGYGGTDQTLYTVNARTITPTVIDLTSSDVQGTFNYQYPIYTITINTVTNGSNPSISLTNGVSTVTVSTTFTAADVLVLNSGTLEVTLNGNLIDFTGIVPSINITDAAITVSDTLTARNIDIDVLNTPRYI